VSGRVRVLIVDDHPLLRQGVAASLEEAGGFEIVGQGGSADDAERLARTLLPDLVLLDISMPGSGLDAARRIAQAVPSTRIVMLTVSEADEDIMTALRVGAVGYVLKGVGSSALAEILTGISRGETYVSPSLAARLLTEMRRPPPQAGADDPLARLTQREEEILRLVATGKSNKEVAIELVLQEKTVKHHMTRILSKLQVRNRTEAAVVLRDRSPGRI
jgi:two-component system, NarL family, nitrate/nitrite response regulator NarL